MKQNSTLFLAVLLGAITTAVGMGTVLHLANNDRVRLAEEIDRARDVAAEAVQEKERIASEASGKIDQANAEILNAQRVLADLEKERKLLSIAVRLDPPATRDVRGWTAVASDTLEVSLRLPPGAAVQQNTDTQLTAIRSSRPTDAPWLRVTPFDARMLAEFEASLSEPSERAYLIDGHLVSGMVGMRNDTRTWSFRVWHSATSTHAFTLTDPGLFGSGNGIERFLSTMTFGK